MAMLDTTCQHGLPELLEHHTLWMVNHPDYLRRMLRLLSAALEVNYHRAATLDHIVWLRCLLAVNEAMNGRIGCVHEELCLVQGQPDRNPILQPNGTFHQQIQGIELTQSSTTAFLEHFFAAYVEFLRRVGQHEFSNFLEGRLGKLLNLVARDERRPGVVQALLYDKGRGHSRFVHVSIEHQNPDDTRPSSKEAIIYKGRMQDSIDATMQEAAQYALLAADSYLRRTGYPDGLTERVIRWEIATVRGDVAGPAQVYQGGSVALPLAVAIVSEYLARPVTNDIVISDNHSYRSTTNRTTGSV
jgi:hypothetical protein